MALVEDGMHKARYGRNMDAVLYGSWKTLWPLLIWHCRVAERVDNGMARRETEALKLGIPLSPKSSPKTLCSPGSSIYSVEV